MNNIMRKTLLLFLTICSIGVCIGESGYAFTDNKVNTIKDAMIRLLCFEVYWEWDDHRLGETLPMKIKIDDRTLHIWINDLKVNDRAHMAGYFVGRLKNDDVAIIRHEAYNINLIPLAMGYLKNKPLFDDKDVIEDVVTIPSDCTPHYDPPTPQKELMLRTVISTVQLQFSGWVRQGIAKYPQELTIIISDFNIDYPSAYILVEQTKKVYRVTLHDPQNYDSEEYEQSGEYPFGQVYNISKSLLAKIRKHGIVRKIVLTP